MLLGTPISKASVDCYSGFDNVKVAFGCGELITNLNEDLALNYIKINDQYKGVGYKDMPAVVNMSEAQKAYLLTVVQAAFRVVLEGGGLEDGELIFGKGLFYYPKNPKKPSKVLKYYPSENFEIENINLSFSRKFSSEPWSACSIGVTPRNFPPGVYFIDLPENFLGDFVFENVSLEERPTHSIKRVNVFRFHHKDKINVKLFIEAAENASGVHEKFPKSFYFIQLISNYE